MSAGLHNLAKALAATALVAAWTPLALGQARESWSDNLSAQRNVFGVQGQKLAYLDDKGTPTQPTKALMEYIPGNGTRAGYMLSHGGIVPSSVHLSAGTKVMRANVDYYLDPASGALFFAEPVSRFSSIHVSYNYVEGQDGARSPMGLGGVGFNFNGTSLNIGMGMSNSGGLDFTTYGLNLNSKLSGGSTLNGLVYFSTPAGNRNNLVGPNAANLRSAASTVNSADAVNDHLIAQTLNIKSGAANFRATYQDIGTHFNGFQAMRQANSTNADAMAQIAALEKERGVKRLGFGTGLALAKTSDLGLNWDQIDDGHDKIVKQSLGFNSGGLKFNYSAQTVGTNFAQFGGLREAEAGQWAKEKGVKRQNLTLGFAAGKGGTFNFEQGSVGDMSGSLDRQAFGFANKTMSFAFSDRKAGAKFSRLKDLTDAEKTSLALDIRRQFNPNAQAGEVSAKDKEQITLDAGLDRSQMAFSTDLGKKSKFGFNQFSIADAKGSIDRQTFSFNTGNLAFNYLDQRISSEFGRLGSMSDFERAQFGNERGIHRNAMGLNLALSKSSTFAFSQLSLADAEGGLSRQSFEYAGKGFGLRFKTSDTAASFARARDLAGMSDPEKNAIEAERGYKRSDLGLNLTLSKTSTIAFTQLDLTGATDHLQRQGFAYAAKGVDFKANFADTSKGFDRVRNLLGLTDAEKNNVEAERGYKRSEYILNVTSFKGLKLSSYLYDAANGADQLGKANFRHNIVWAVNKVSQINLLSEGDGFSKAGRETDGRRHDLYTLDTMLAKGMKLNLYRDTLAQVSGGNVVPSIATDFLHFETDRSKANNLMAETKRIDFGNGKFENTTLMDMNYRANKAMVLQFNRLSVDRGKDPSADTDTLRWNWQLAKTMNFSGSFIGTTTNNHQDAATNTYALDGMLTKTLKLTGAYAETRSEDGQQNATAHTLGLSGTLTKDLNFAGNYTERTQRGKMVAGVSDFAMSNAKPVNMLGLKQVTFTAKMAATDDREKKQTTENVTGQIKGLLGKNQFGLEYGGALDAKGNDAMARTFTFISDPNEKLPFHCNILYKARNVNRGDLQLVRKYDMSMRLDKLTNLTYAYSSLPEDAAGNMQPVKSSSFAFRRVVTKTINLTVDYTTLFDATKKTDTRKFGAFIKGTLDKINAIEVGYSVDTSTLNGNLTDSHTIRLSYDHKVDADHFVTLSAAYAMYRHGGSDDLQTNVDVKTIF